MIDWRKDLGEALASGNPEFMKAMFGRVPKEVLLQAIPLLGQQAKASEKAGRLEEALSCCDALIEVMPQQIGWYRDRAGLLLKLQRFEPAWADARRVTELDPERASGYRLQAQACEGLGDGPGALAAWQQAQRIEPNDAVVRQHISRLSADIHKQAVVNQALDPASLQAALANASAAPPQRAFDPALLGDASIPASSDRFRVDGLRQHLMRYSSQLSAKHAITRLEDPAWLAVWDAALPSLAGQRVEFLGSELGVLALRALRHGAAHVRCNEAFATDKRITLGMVQKHFLSSWHARHREAIEGWSEDERRASFDDFTRAIDVVSAGDPPPAAPADVLVFPAIDHTLLGTGIVNAIRAHRAQAAGTAKLRVLPARAAVFAMGIQWAYPGSDHRLEPMNRLRWSLYPQALDLGPEFWAARTQAMKVADIDFEDFHEGRLDISLPVTADGHVDAIVFWFELELGGAQISSAPIHSLGSALRCLRPAVQYTDPIGVRAGNALLLQVRVEPGRLSFHTLPPATQLRMYSLPSWYVPMLGDRRRNEAYRSALVSTLAAQPASLVLDIGAGCGLLSMMAAQAGATRVIGCETHPAILAAGREIAALNGLDDRITLIGKDCRQLQVPDDLPQRADLVVFELFDCSLIGEGILHFLAQAREHLLAEGARYLPAFAKIRAMVVEYRIDLVWDIDANLLNPYRASPAFINVDASALAYRPLTETFDVFSFDFATTGPAPQDRELDIPVIAAGTAGAVLFWFDLGLNADTWISNAPDAVEALHWKQGLQVLPEVRIDPGLRLPLLARHNGSGLKFQWLQGALPKDAFSSLPRFDPRSLAAASELEQQTQGLLQHCSQNPDEYAKVADVAQRFAIDPATHGLDPTIAQRFAAMLLGG